LGPLFEHYGVNIVFSGHDHNYEHTIPIGGVTYVVSGGGGRSLYPAATSEWTAFSKASYHASYVSIDGGRLSLEAVEPDDTVMDRLDLSQ
jgi:acid phosphatase type 7